jgi:transposase
MLVYSQAELLEARLMVEKLKLQILHYKRARFGASSERLTELAQLELLVEELESERAAIDTDTNTAASVPGTSDAPDDHAGGQRKRPARKPLPDHLPRETVVHQPANTERCACAGCNGMLRLLGQDVAEVLEIVPARFKVIRHVRPKYACAKCQAIVQAAAPGRPIASFSTRSGRCRLVGTCPGEQVCRSPPSLPTERDLRAGRRRAGKLDPGRHGRRCSRTARASAGRLGAPCPGGRQAAWRRHAGAGARTRQGPHQDGQALGLCAR